MFAILDRAVTTRIEVTQADTGSVTRRGLLPGNRKEEHPG